MNPDHVALVALARTPPGGVSWAKLTEALLAHGSAVEVWERHHGQALLACPAATQALADAERDLAAWQLDGLRFIGVLDDDFPQRLLDITETPPFLIAHGTLCADDPGVAVVGSRNASPAGLAAAAGIARYLAWQGLTVISGLAAGIDTAVHTAALAAGGRTVAFIATGAQHRYPPQNRALQAEIAGKCLVLSPFWPDTPPAKEHFLIRNALMSGYGLATVVVEAGEHSGTRALARTAVAHGRPVILTEQLVHTNAWARALAACPGVHVISNVDQLGPLIERLRAEPLHMQDALQALTGP